VQRLGAQRVEPASTVDPDVDEPRVSQDLEVL
jgi:hypothetical protein